MNLNLFVHETHGKDFFLHKTREKNLTLPGYPTCLGIYVKQNRTILHQHLAFPIYSNRARIYRDR